MSARKSIKQVSKPAKEQKKPIFWIAVVVWAVFVAVVLIWFSVGKADGGRGAGDGGYGAGMPDEIRNAMFAAIELEPFLNSARGVYSANAQEKGWDSLGMYPVNWGVVLGDGTVVLNPAEGNFAYDKESGRPTMIDWGAQGGDVMIIFELGLPEVWREHRIVIIPGVDETTHFVNVTQPNKPAQDAAADDTACGLWQWQDGAYCRIGNYVPIDGEVPGDSGASV